MVPWQRGQLLRVEDGGHADRAHRDPAEAADEERAEDIVTVVLSKDISSKCRLMEQHTLKIVNNCLNCNLT